MPECEKEISTATCEGSQGGRTDARQEMQGEKGTGQDEVRCKPGSGRSGKAAAVRGTRGGARSHGNVVTDEDNEATRGWRRHEKLSG